MTSNFSDPAVFAELPHDNRSHVVYAVNSSLLAIATIAVSLRFYTRFTLLKKVGVDDYLALASLIATWSASIAQFISIRYGLGSHIWDISAEQGPDELISFFKSFYAILVGYNSGLMFVKLTFLAQYYRVLPTDKFRAICKGAIVVVGAWSLSQLLMYIFNCTPIPRFWDRSIEGSCISPDPQWYITAGGNIMTDLIVFLLPLPALTNLSIPIQQRAILVGIFCLGFFTVAISAVRIKYLVVTTDFTYDFVDPHCWSAAELCSGITCACLPTLRPLLAQLCPRYFPIMGTSTKSTTPRDKATILPIADSDDDSRHLNTK